MQEKDRTYVAIDLKSFYASVECVERGLDPLDTNLVVADRSRTNKTICLAISPSLKSFGISGRPRLFEVEQAVKRINAQRLDKAPGHRFSGSSFLFSELQKDPGKELAFLTAPPRMGKYVEFSTDIYNVYLKYVSAQDIHVYSIDEVFMDVTDYLNTYGMSAHELTLKMIRDVMKVSGVTATAGIGTNLYLAKAAMDIVAKHLPADEDGVRIAQIDETAYRRLLWDHEPLTDFWRVGRAYQKRLAQYGLHTMGDIARFSLKNDGILYKEFGINAELLIDHAWGYEPCTMKDIKAYKPAGSSLGSGQVLMEPYKVEKALIVLKEMADALALDLVGKGLCTDHVSLYVGYDISNDTKGHQDRLKKDYYGRTNIAPATGSCQLGDYTSSSKLITEALLSIFEKTVDKKLLIRRINITAEGVISRQLAAEQPKIRQTDLFHDETALEAKEKALKEELAKEDQLQHAILDIKRRFGKNSILKGTDLEDGATGRQRNEQIGGHHE